MAENLTPPNLPPKNALQTERQRISAQISNDLHEFSNTGAFTLGSILLDLYLGALALSSRSDVESSLEHALALGVFFGAVLFTCYLANRTFQSYGQFKENQNLLNLSYSLTEEEFMDHLKLRSTN